MKIRLDIEDIKLKKTKKFERTMMLSVYTDIPGMEKVTVAAIIPKKSALSTELNTIVADALALKKKQNEKKNTDK